MKSRAPFALTAVHLDALYFTVKSLAVLCYALSLFACSGTGSVTTEPYSVVFRSNNDDGEPLAGVELSTQGQKLGVTVAGSLELELGGREGQVVPVTVACPAGYLSPVSAVELKLSRMRKVGDREAGAIPFEAVCQRIEREVVVIVRAENGAGLPVYIDGKLMGTTNPDGILHVRVAVDRSTRSLNVSLDTSGAPALRPLSPSRSYALAGADAIVMFETAFAKRAPAVRQRASVAQRYIPYRVH